MLLRSFKGILSCLRLDLFEDLGEEAFGALEHPPLGPPKEGERLPKSRISGDFGLSATDEEDLARKRCHG